MNIVFFKVWRTMETDEEYNTILASRCLGTKFKTIHMNNLDNNCLFFPSFPFSNLT